MVETVSSTLSAAKEAEQQLRTLQRQTSALAQQINQKSQVSNVQTFQKNTRDIVYDNSVTARDIGKLIENKSRLNLFSALSKNDKADVFRFSTAGAEKTRLGVLIEDEGQKDSLRIQIFARGSNRLIADNGAKNGEVRENYEKLIDGNFSLAKGEYILRISRKDGVDSRQEKQFNYALQLSQGLYEADYDTVEKAARADDNPFGISNTNVGTSNLSDGLLQASSFISSLPKIGVSAIYKLAGALYNSIF